MNTYLLWSMLLLLAWRAAAECPYVWRAPLPSDLLLELVVPAGGAVWTLPAGGAPGRRRQLVQAGVFTVYWGDNTVVQTCSAAAPCTHTFASAGVFTTVIEGPVAGWAMTLAWREQNVDGVALRSIAQWGGLELATEGGYHFYGEAQLLSLPPLSAIDTSRVTSFAFSFAGLSACTDVSALDPRSALVLTGAFAHSPCLTFANVSAWDVSRVRDLSLAFAGTTVTGISGLERWNVSRVVNATGLFANATALQADLSHWRLDSLQDATDMLAGAPQLAQNLGGWNVAWTQQTCLQLVQPATVQVPSACQQWLPAQGSPAVLVVNAATASPAQYALPFLPDANAGGSFPYTASWGDGTATSTCDNTAPCTHLYAAAGNYTISLTGAAIVGFTTRDALVLTGNCTDQTLANGSPWHDSDGPTYDCATYYTAPEVCVGSEDYVFAGLTAYDACCACGGGILERDLSVPVLTSVQSWGPVRLHTSAGAHFAGSLLTSAPPPLPASSGLRSLVRLLDGLRSLGSATLNVSALDTSVVTNLTDLTSGAPQLGLVGLGSWDTSAVVDATRAFKGNAGPLAGVALWNVSALEYAVDMFKRALVFDEDLSGWQPRRLRAGAGLFALASAFRGRGVGGWSSENLATNSTACGEPFHGTRCLPQSCVWPAWCYNASLVFEARINVLVRNALKQLYVLTTTSSNPLQVNYGAGGGWVSCNQASATTNTPNICRPVTNTGYAAVGTYTLLITGRLDGLLSLVTRANDNQLKFEAIYSWGNVSLATPPAYVINDGTLLSGFLTTSNGAWWNTPSTALTNLVYLAPTNGTNALARVTRADYLFRNAYRLVGDLSDWRVAFTGSAAGAWANARQFNQDISAWPMSAVTDTSFMFAGAEQFNQPLDPWGVSTWSMESMFDGAVAFNQPLPSWNQQGTLTNIRSMFKGARAFNQPLGAWDMSALVVDFGPTDEVSPFAGCCSFVQDLSAWPLPTTLADCQALATDSRLTYATLPDYCPAGSYTTWDYAQACAV